MPTYSTVAGYTGNYYYWRPYTNMYTNTATSTNTTAWTSGRLNSYGKVADAYINGSSFLVVNRPMSEEENYDVDDESWDRFMKTDFE